MDVNPSPAAPVPSVWKKLRLLVFIVFGLLIEFLSLFKNRFI